MPYVAFLDVNEQIHFNHLGTTSKTSSIRGYIVTTHFIHDHLKNKTVVMPSQLYL